MKSTEIEVRGPLTPEGAEALMDLLKKKNAKIVVYDEVALFFNTDAILSFGSYAAGAARLQANQKKYAEGRVEQVAKMKIGNPSGTSREEHEFSFNGHGLKTFLDIVHRLGITEASFRGCTRHDYVLDNLTFSLKFGHPIGDHYEAEISGGSKEELLGFLTPLGLTVWGEDEFRTIILDARTNQDNGYISLEEGIVKYSIL